MEKGTFRKKIENYWYHYKWHTIICVFFAIVVVICSVQMFKKDKTDISAVYAGPAILSDRALTDMENAFEEALPAEVRGRGVTLIGIVIMSDSQIEAAQNAAREESTFLFFSESYRKEAREQLNVQMGSGESIICLFDQYIYDGLNEKNAFISLNEALGYTPSYARDEYSVYLKDTPFGAHFLAFDQLPDDTILCMRKMAPLSTLKGKKSEEERYARHMEAFRAVFSFSPQEN